MSKRKIAGIALRVFNFFWIIHASIKTPTILADSNTFFLLWFFGEYLFYGGKFYGVTTVLASILCIVDCVTTKYYRPLYLLAFLIVFTATFIFIDKKERK